MENRLKLKLSKLFQSCQSKKTSDVSGEPFFFPENRHYRQLIALFSPKPKRQIHNKPHPKTSDKTTSFSAGKDFRRPQKTTKKKSRYRKPKNMEYISSTTHSYYYDWRSSDDEDDIDDETTLFSSRSESSGSFRKNKAYRKPEKKTKSGKLVKDSVAVAKKSSNPHEDFKVSMVEMIVEQKIFVAEDLKNLFECFISLNSEEHHRVIFEVFVEILEAMFSDSSD